MLVTDVGLPGGMNGRQMAEAARDLLPGVPILFVTGYAEHALLGDQHLLPGMQVMVKPFEMAAFGQKVQGLLKVAAHEGTGPGMVNATYLA